VTAGDAGVMGDAGGLDGVLERLDRLESERAIRDLVATYFELCDRLDGPAALAGLGGLFTLDAAWTGSGRRYGAAFGTHLGRDAIIAMFARYAGPPPHFALNAHFLGNERIDVDGDRATGRWLMVQMSSYTAGDSDLRAASLALRFERAAGRWCISRFETENLFSRRVDRWNDEAPIPVPQS
jgi:hypothetical protein